MISRRQWDDMEEAMDRVLSVLESVDRTSEHMKTVLMVREPNSTAAAEAYEGLRRQVVATATERRQHLVQLAEFETAIQNGADQQQLASLVDGWMSQAGLVRVASASPEEVPLLFDLTEDLGGDLVVSRPAYVDSRTQAVVLKGRAQRRAVGQPSQLGESTSGDLEENR